MAVGLTGQEFTVSQGTAIAPNDTVQPSGLSITSAQGTATGSSSNQVDVQDFQCPHLLGTAVAPNNTVVLSGLSGRISI